LPGAVPLDELDALDEPAPPPELLELLDELELLPHAASASTSAKALIAASPNHLMLAFTGFPFAGERRKDNVRRRPWR
jgi:hypothetical protein